MKNAVITVNNYTLGRTVPSMPTDKIVRKERKDRYHTEIEFADVTDRDIRLITNLLGGYKNRVTIKEA